MMPRIALGFLGAGFGVDVLRFQPDVDVVLIPVLY